MFLERFVFGPQLLGWQLIIHNSRKISRAESAQIRRKKIYLRPVDAIEVQRMVRNFLQMARERRIVQRAQAFKLLIRQPSRPREPIVIIYRPSLYPDL